MGRSLDANAVYGFSMQRCPEYDYETDSYPENFGLPEGFTQGLTSEEIAKQTYMELEDLGLEDLVGAIIRLKYPLLDLAYPGTEETDEIVIFVARTKLDAYYGSEPLVLEESTTEEEQEIRSLAVLLGKTPGWLLYPTYG